MTVVVYKLGGSLLTLPGFEQRLERLLASRPDDERPLVVVGGGAAADVVREWDRLHGLGDERAHRLAIRAMGLNAAFVAALLPHGRLSTDRNAACLAWSAGAIPIISVPEFLEREEPLDDRPLPASWDVTGDSISAWIARRWPAERLVLVKSTSPAANTLEAAANCGLVDPWFPTFAKEIASLAWVNLCSEPPTVEPWPL